MIQDECCASPAPITDICKSGENIIVGPLFCAKRRVALWSRPFGPHTCKGQSQSSKQRRRKRREDVCPFLSRERAPNGPRRPDESGRNRETCRRRLVVSKLSLRVDSLVHCGTGRCQFPRRATVLGDWASAFFAVSPCKSNSKHFDDASKLMCRQRDIPRKPRLISILFGGANQDYRDAELIKQNEDTSVLGGTSGQPG